MTSLRSTRIVATGSALPDRVVPNAFFESYLETSDAWIVERTGIHERRFAGDGETTSTLSSLAAERAMEAAGVPPESIDLVIVATFTPDRPLPSTAAFVQARLGLSCPAFDLNAACAGFVYALSVGSAQIAAGAAERVLVIGGEVMSRVLDLNDRGTCVLFGDGAGAVLVEPSEEPGIESSILALDGKLADLLTIYGGGSAEPLDAERVADGRQYIRMPDGPAVFKRAVTGMAEACSELLDKAGMTADDVSVVIPHQANSRIMFAVADRLHLPRERVFTDIAGVGNTSAGSIPIAMDHAWRAGKLQPGDTVLTAAFGAGLAWGANLIRWSAPPPGDGA